MSARIVLFGVTLATSLMLSAGAARAADDTYRVGLLHSFSGYLASVGIAYREGFMIGVDEINESGGINGKKIEVFIENDESDTAKGVPAALRLLNNEKVRALFGPGRSDVTEAIGPMVEKAHVVNLTSSVTLPTHHDFTFAASTLPDKEAKLMIDYAKRKGAKSVAVLSAMDFYSKSLGAAIAAEAVRQGIKVAATESYNNATDRNFIPQLSKFKAADADWMFLAGSLSGLVLKQKGDIGYKAPVTGNVVFTAQGMDSLRQMAGAELDSASFTAMQLTVWESLPEGGAAAERSRRFIKAFQAKYGRLPEVEKLGYAMGYDQVLMLADAAKRAGPGADGLKLKEAFEATTNFVGANGIYTYSPTVHASNDGVVIAEIRNGVPRIAD